MEKKSLMGKSKFEYLFFYLLALIICIQCTPSKKLYKDPPSESDRISKSAEVRRSLPLRTSDSLIYLIENNPILKNHFVGFVLHDPADEKDIVSINGSRPFTPASNMKLYTLYTSLNYLEARITALEYFETDDSLIVKGVGDPSFLDPYQKDNNFAFDFLSNTDKEVFLDLSSYKDKRYGSGWAWDDYPYYYQAEKSGFPIYANKFYIRKAVNDSLVTIAPTLFERYISVVKDSISPSISRQPHSNDLVLNNYKLNKKLVNWDMPFSNSQDLTLELLSDTLSTTVKLYSKPSDHLNFKKLKGISTDSLLQELMTISDNFIAEQLLLMCSYEQLGHMQTSDIIKHAKKDLFADMPDTIKWVDGSGLSRYNLITPNSTIWVLNKILTKWDFQKIQDYFPSGKGNDTLDESFQYEKPWIFAKTGSLSNNFNLSGYLITRSNRRLLFSFMNNHYMDSRSEVINEMNEILSFIRDNY